MDKFERIEQEERLRAERMKNVLQERLRENEIEKAKKEVFLGECPSFLLVFLSLENQHQKELSLTF